MDLLNDKSLISREYIEGVHLFKQGDEAKEAFLVYSGAVRIYKKDGNEEKELAILGSGEIIGEMALITHKDKHSSYAVAHEKSVVVVITKDALQKKLSNADPLLNTMLLKLAERVYKSNQQSS